ncbi:MAG: GC-type dockerin domain-anchored protein [Candidatus Competibacteraceae bacterium]
MHRAIFAAPSRTRAIRPSDPAIPAAKRRLASLASGTALCLAMVAGQPALGQSCSINIPGVPDFDQKRATTSTVPGLPNDGAMYCVPTSATDWFAYIANHGVPEVLDGPRDWQSQDHYDFVTDRIKHIGELMGTDAEDGTTGLGPIIGLVSHLQATAPGAFIVTASHAIPGVYILEPEELFNAMSNGGMISMTLGKYQNNNFGHWERTGGHIVALHRVKDGCSSSPELWWNDPSTSDSMIVQADFDDQTSEMEEVSGLWSVSGFGVPQTMWRFSSLSGNKFLESYTVITPMVALTTDDQWDTLVASPVNVLDGGEQGEELAEDAPDGGQFDHFQFHPLRVGTFYATTTGQNGSVKLYKYDPRQEALRILRQLEKRTPFAFGRHGDLYLVDAGQLIRFDTLADSEGLAVLGSFDLKGAMPDAMVYDDLTDEVTLLFAATRRLLTVSRDLTTMRDRTLPAEVELVGDVLLANTSLGRTLWIGGTQSPTVYELSPTTDGSGRWQTRQTVTLPAVQKPTSLQAGESGSLIVVENGVVREFAYNARTRRWEDAPRSYLAGMKAGRRLVLARSRTNFDAKTMTGPGWTNYDPTEENDAGGIPDCPADLSGGADPREPTWGMPDGIVNEADSTYFRIQYERGNLRVADVTGPASPGVPDRRLTEDDLRYYRALHDRSVGHCPTESPPSK